MGVCFLAAAAAGFATHLAAGFAIIAIEAFLVWDGLTPDLDPPPADIDEGDDDGR